MNITFLIGNGFDVGIGMKSRFRDFFPVYQQNSCDKPENIKMLAQEIGADYDTWADFEMALGKYTLKFNRDTKKDFLNQVRDFEIDFIKYLKESEKTLNFENTEEVSNVMKNAMLNFYSLQNLAPESNSTITNVYSTRAQEVRTYNFINFNYTSSLEKCLATVSQKIVRKRKYNLNEIVDKVGDIVHVHGSCDMYPIIGVNDKEQIANKDLASDTNFAKYIIKPSINDLIRQGYNKNAMSVINNSTIICIYGMSMGATDKVWWDLIIKWLYGSEARQLILFEYDDKYTTSTPFEWLDKEDFIIEKLKNYNSDVRINVQRMRQRIHIAIHKNIFSMDLLHEKRK